MKIRLLIGVTILLLTIIGPDHPPTLAQTNPAQKLIFATGQVGGFGMFVMNPDGTESRPLTDAIGFDSGPVISPDGQWVAFETLRFGDPIARPEPQNWEVYVMRSDGTSSLRLTNDPAWDSAPSWMPDSRTLLFMSNRTGQYELYRVAIDGTGLQALTNGPGNSKQPHVSADGSQIVFLSDRDGNQEIYAMNADGSNQRRLTNTPENEETPKWSPDGTQIAFSTTLDDLHAVISLMNADGSNVRRVTPGTFLYRNPAWSPDGQWLAYNSNQDAAADVTYFNGMEIYIMRPDGSDVRRLTVNTFEDTDASWFPLVEVVLGTPTGTYFYPGYSPVAPTGVAFAFAEVAAQAVVAGNYQEAVVAYTEAINVQPDSDTLFVERARAYMNLGDYATALLDLDTALALNHYNSGAYILRGFAYTYLENYESALADANRVVELAPNSSCGFGLLGMIYHAMGQFEIARGNLQIYVGMGEDCLPEATELYNTQYNQ